MTDMTVNAPCRFCSCGAHAAHSSASLWRDRLRASARPAGVELLGAAIVSLIYFFPVFWIILTAFKTYEDALAVPAKFFFTPTLENFAQVFSRAYSAGGPTVRTPASRFISSIRCSFPA